MSKADDILKKYGITQVRGSEGSSSKAALTASNQKTTGTSASKADSILAKYGITQVRGSEGGTTVSLTSTSDSAQSWLDSSKSYLSDAEKYLSSWRKRNDKDEEYASLMKRNSSLIAEAYNWRNQYTGDDEAVSYIDEVISALSNSRGSFKKYLDYYDQWDTEDDYKKALQYSTLEGRQEQYDQNKKRLEELKLQRNSLHYQPGMNPYTNSIGPNTMPIYGPGYGAAKEDTKTKATELEKEIAALEKEIRLYEYGETDEDGFYYGFKTADDYGKRLQDSRFVSASKNRAYQNADRSELDAYDISQSEGSTAISNGGYFDEEGNIRNAKGEIVQYASAPEVQDKLGLFLSASQKDIEEAYNILSASNGNYETTWADIMQEGDTKRWKYLKDDELQIYYGLLRLEGQEAAYRYLDAMEVELGRREMKETYAAIEESSGLEQIMLNAASVPMNMFGGIAATVDNASRLLQGKDLNPYSRAQSLSSAGNYIRYNTAQEIDEATGGLAIPGLDFSFGDAYQAGMSMVDSLVGAKIGGKAYQAVMSMGAASTEAARLYSQGASTEQIVLGSVAAGAAEWVFEKYSIENLISLKAPESKLKWVKNALIQGGIEMSEEAATELANIITNGLIMQSESDWAKLLEENGGDYGKAIKAMSIQIANAGLGGFLSGLGSGAIQQGMQYGAQQQENVKIGKYISGANSTDALMALAQEMAANATKGDQKRLTAQSERLGKDFLTERGKNRATGRLYNTVRSVINEQNIGEISSALQEKGFSKKDATAIADVVAAQTNGIDLSDDQQKVLDKFGSNENVKAVLADILDNAESGINQRAKSIAKFEFGAMRNHIISQAEKALAEQEKTSASDKVDTQKESASEINYEASADGETILKSTGETVSIREIAAIKDGKMTLRLSDGSIVDASEVSYASADEALVYETVAKMGASANAANILVNGFKTANDSGLTASEYAHGIEEAFRYGKVNDKSGLANSVFASKLNPGQQEYVYRQGQRVAGKQVAKEQATVKKMVQAANKATESKDNNKSYRATLEDGISALSLNESQKASYKLADQIAEAAKVNIRVYVGKTGEHGYYNPKTDEIYLNLNATNKSRKSMMAFTLGHELVHRAKNGSPAKYKAFTNFLVEQYGKQDSSVAAMIEEQIKIAKEHDIEISEEKAFEEVVCDACQRMLMDTDAGQKLAEFGAQNKQNKSFLEDLKRWIMEFMDKLRSIFEGVEPDSLAAQEFAKFDESVKQILADMYVEMTIDAGENLSVIQNAFGKDTQVHANENGEFTMANSEDGSKKVFNLVTWNNGGRETLEATLLREGYTEDEVKAALTIMDEKQRLVESIANEVDGNGKMAFPEQGRINEATLTTDLKDGHSVLSALVSNGDYPVNIDLLMVCKKRKAYQRVINRLCETGLIQQATVDALAIAEINKILGKYGFETACLGCFVESRRLRIQEWAQTICSEWNSEVKKRNPNAKAFGFGKGEATLTPDEVMKIIGELESGGEKNDKGNLNLGQGSAVKRMGVLLDKVPSLQRTLSIEDLVTPDGLTSLRSFDSNLFSMVKSRYGSNSPKFVQEFNPYNHELAQYGKVPTQYESLREYLYAIGGARMQSFSDFIIENWFDYCQIVADLAARKLPMHTYTKEIALAKLFGLTGIKINMSLIPDVDRSLGKEFAGLTRNAKGELELIWADKDRFKATGGKSYMQSINFADAIALQNDPRYSANVGTIAVGISDKHIEVMLDDTRIRMIIPYHSSGMNPIFADLMGTSYYKDYTNFQNTTIKQIYNSKGQKVTLKLDKTETGKLTGGFQFNEVLQDLGDARAAAEAYKEWCADASKHTITIKGETYTAELTPKFNDFSGHQNYYKLLEDFNTYDCISEEAARQGDVQQIYPENFDEILKAELSAQERHRQKQEANQAFDKAMGEIESYLKNHSKADTVYYANQHGIKLGAKDKKLNAAEKEKLKKLQAEGVSFKLPHNDISSYQEPAYHDWQVEAALYDAMEHKDMGDDNLINIGNMPRYIVDKIGIEGDFFIYRNHAYENMVTVEQAKKDERFSAKAHYHGLGIEKMTDAVMALENPIMTIATKTKDGNPAVIMLLPVLGKNKAPLYAVLSFYSDRKINGDYSRKPHIVLTIAEREFFGNNGRDGHAEIIATAVRDGRVIDFDKKMRDSLSVIANQARVGDITEASLTANLSHFLKEIKHFREKNNIDYKLPVGEDTSPRALLANAFDTVITNPIEKNKLQEYKKNVAMLNEEEAKLRELREQIKDLSFAKGPKDTKKIRNLQFEANQTANRINTLDKMLLRFEASAPLQNVLNREKELAYKRADKKRKDDLAAYRERAAKTQRELLDRWEESRKRGIEGRQKTAMRHKIKDVVNDLNQYLLKGTKDRHVPIGLQKAVAEALNAVNMDTVGAEERIAKLNAELMKAKTPEAIQEISKKIEHIREMGDRMDEKLKRLKTAYDEFINSDDPLIANSHDDAVSAHMMKLIVRVGDTPLREMTLDQLQDVYDVYKVVLATIRNANKSFKDNKNREISTRANQVMAEIDDLGVKRGKRPIFMSWIEKFGWDGLKPVYAMEHIGSQGLIDAYNNVRAGEDTWAKDIVEAREYYLEKFRKYKYDSWDFEKKHKFTSTTEMNFELTLDQIMSLYAYSKRDQAADHLKYGGIVFDPKREVVENTKSGIKVKYNVADATAYNISEETLADIIGTLTEDQKGFVDEMQTYLSDVMGAKGNEVSLTMYDVKLFREKHYFPLKSAHQYMAKAKEQAQGDVKIKNSGFSKETKPHAKNPIVLSSFMDVWSSHVNEMSMYHAFVLPMEDFYRIYNYTTPSKDETLPTEGVNASIENAYGSGATEYIEQMLKDLNGGARSDSRANLPNKMIGWFKKGAVFASLSVVVQQPSAIARAAALVDTKYFIGPKVDQKRHKALWDEVKQYAPVAIIKEMGYFDTNMGKSTQDFIMGQEYSGFSEKMKALVTDSNYRDEVLSKAPALADEIAWCGIWEAVKRETKAKNPGMDVTSEEFLKTVGERFTEVIVKTQVYDSVLARSSMMRSKDGIVKMATAFMAEPTTSINMVADALLKGKRGNRKYCRTAIGAVVASQILNSILVSFVYAARDDDEDETYAEKYISSLVGGIVDGLNPATYIPFIKDIVSITQGYDVERSDMSVVSDIFKAWEQLKNDDVSVYRKVEDFAGSIAKIFGLPVKNLMRDTRAFWQTVVQPIIDKQKGIEREQTTGTGIKYAVKGAVPKWMGGGDVSNQQQLYEAIISGDKDQTARVKSRFKDQNAINSAIRKALRENDPRIHEAAIAWNANDLDEYMRIAKQIIAEKHFVQDDVVMAIRSEANELAPDDGETSTSKAKGLFTAEKFAEAISQGDQATAYAIKTDIIQTHQKNGKTADEAEKSFNSSAKNDLKDMFIDGKISESKSVATLVSFCDMDQEDAKNLVDGWMFEKKNGFAYSDRVKAYKNGEVTESEMRTILAEFGGLTELEIDNNIKAYNWMKRNPQYDLTVNEALAYTKPIEKLGYSVEDSGIDPDTFVEYRELRSECEGIDSDGDGTADRNSEKNQVLEVINNLPITNEQKDVLYYLNGWAASNLRKAPWR